MTPMREIDPRAGEGARRAPLSRLLLLLAILAGIGCAQSAAKPAAPAAPQPPAWTLQQVFGDLGDLVRAADRGQIELLKIRLGEAEDELRLVESLKGALDRGILVEIPAPLRERQVREATPQAVEHEERTYDTLLAEVRLAEIRKSQPKGGAGAAPAPAVARSSSALGQAALGVQLDIPVPPKAASGSQASARAALDPEGLGKSLYASQDWSGALNALSAVPEAKRSLEVRCIIARCLERTGRWNEARPIYEKVAAEDKDGPWGNMAQWMLRFGEHLRSVRERLASADGAAPGGRS